MQPDYVKQVIRKAFSPYRAVFDEEGFDDPVRFKVRLDSGETVLDQHCEIDQDESDLRNQLKTYREEIERKGHKLDPWP